MLGHGMSLFSVIFSSGVAASLLSPFAMWPAFPTSDYYGDSVPRRPLLRATRMPFVFRRAGRAVAVPTFTEHRWMGEAPSFTPTASLRVHRSFPRSLRTPIGLGTCEAGRS